MWSHVIKPIPDKKRSTLIIWISCTYNQHTLQIKQYFRFISECFDFYKFIQTFALHFEKPNSMSRVCELTGKKMIVGNTVSHSNIKTKRRFYPNLQTKRFFIPEENKWITLKVSTSALRTINKNGISACLKEAREKGFLTNK